MYAVLADRAEQGADEASVPAAPQHEQIGALGRGQQDGRRVALDHPGLDRDRVPAVASPMASASICSPAFDRCSTRSNIDAHPSVTGICNGGRRGSGVRRCGCGASAARSPGVRTVRSGVARRGGVGAAGRRGTPDGGDEPDLLAVQASFEDGDLWGRTGALEHGAAGQESRWRRRIRTGGVGRSACRSHRGRSRRPRRTLCPSPIVFVLSPVLIKRLVCVVVSGVGVRGGDGPGGNGVDESDSDRVSFRDSRPRGRG